MTVTHHPDISTLMAFSAGTLDEPYAAVIATHLAMSEGGRETLRHMNQIGGALLESEPKAALADNALERLMGSLSDQPIVVPSREAAPSDVPLPLRTYLPKGLGAVKWRWTGPGVATADLAWGRNGRSRLMLLRVAAGKPVPASTWRAGTDPDAQGAYRDRFGVFAVGDIADHDEDVEHQPIAEPGEDCVCLVAVDAKLTFQGRLMRALQPLFGI